MTSLTKNRNNIKKTKSNRLKENCKRKKMHIKLIKFNFIELLYLIKTII